MISVEPINNKIFNPQIYHTNIARMDKEVKEYSKYYPCTLKFFKNKDSFKSISNKLDRGHFASLTRIMFKIINIISAQEIKTSYDMVKMLDDIELLSRKVLQVVAKH